MSTRHILEVTCDRCSCAVQLDPVAMLKAQNAHNHNYHPSTEQLYKAAEVRPNGWGESELRITGPTRGGRSRRSAKRPS